MLKIKGLKNAAGDAQRARGKGWNYTIKFDLEDGQLWADVAKDNNTWQAYKKPSIITVFLHGDKPTMKNIEKWATIRIEEFKYWKEKAKWE